MGCLPVWRPKLWLGNAGRGPLVQVGPCQEPSENMLFEVPRHCHLGAHSSFIIIWNILQQTKPKINSQQEAADIPQKILIMLPL